MASSNITRMSREDFRKAKELEELRKTGAAPPELDEEGKMINPHIPEYVSKRPWYLSGEDDVRKAGLKHQYKGKSWLKEEEEANLNRWYKKRRLAAVDHYRKGACTNCGAMTHKVKDCMERPRKKGAKWTKQDIKGDEYIESFDGKLSFDGKRDRWNGYNPENYKLILQKYEREEEARRLKREREIDEKMKRKSETSNINSDDSDSDDNNINIDDELKDSNGKLIQRLDTDSRVTVRNLRIREDTAKYLMNLDVNSAYYDPKTRSMRQNPFEGQDPSEVMYAGDNFVRASGDVSKVTQLNRFVWDANTHGNKDINIIANPSQAEKMFEEFKKKKETLKEQKTKEMIAKYGDQSQFIPDEAQKVTASSETYVEYDEAGNIVKGQEKAIPSTKYMEDVYENNHTAVWGSYWYDGKWGYACCHQTLRRAYCTGEAGKKAAAQQKEMQNKGNKKIYQETVTKKKKDPPKKTLSLKMMGGDTPTNEEMEAYHLSRKRDNDPMKNYV